MPTVIRKYSAPDGTQMTVYSLNGDTVTVPTKVFNKKFKKK